MPQSDTKTKTEQSFRKNCTTKGETTDEPTPRGVSRLWYGGWGCVQGTAKIFTSGCGFTSGSTSSLGSFPASSTASVILGMWFCLGNTKRVENHFLEDTYMCINVHPSVIVSGGGVLFTHEIDDRTLVSQEITTIFGLNESWHLFGKQVDMFFWKTPWLV